MCSACEPTASVALGGNLGDVLATFTRALATMPEHGIEVRAVSGAYRTRAEVLDPRDDDMPDYWNAACTVTTALDPHALLGALHAIEERFGRVRRERWAARTLDLDLLTYGDLCLGDARLFVPHPKLGDRLYVLRPLVEIAAGMIVPPEGLSVTQLLARHKDQDDGILECRSGWRCRV